MEVQEHTDSDSDAAPDWANREVTPEGTEGETSEEAGSEGSSPPRPPVAPPNLKKTKAPHVQRRGAFKPKKLHFGTPQKRKFKGVDGRISKREKLIRLQEKRVKDKEGTWVQCTNASCNKWRHLLHVQEPCTVPIKWVCSMNKDVDCNSCDKPEADYKDLDFICVKHVAGCIVWAKVTGFPWWPAMVDDDPDTRDYFWTNGFSEIPTHYHVVFLDGNVTHAWVATSSIRAFVRSPTYQHIQETKGVKRELKHQLAAAIKRAERALTLSLPERFGEFSFANNFKGRWPETTESSTDSDEGRNEKRLHKQVELVQVESHSDSSGSDIESPKKKRKGETPLKPRPLQTPHEIKVQAVEQGSGSLFPATAEPSAVGGNAQMEVADEQRNNLDATIDSVVVSHEITANVPNDKNPGNNFDATIDSVSHGAPEITANVPNNLDSTIDFVVKSFVFESLDPIVKEGVPKMKKVKLDDKKTKVVKKKTVEGQKKKKEAQEKETGKEVGKNSAVKIKPSFSVKKKTTSEKDVGPKKDPSETVASVDKSVAGSVPKKKSFKAPVTKLSQSEVIKESQATSISEILSQLTSQGSQNDKDDFEELSQLIQDKLSPPSSQISIPFDMEE